METVKLLQKMWQANPFLADPFSIKNLPQILFNYLRKNRFSFCIFD